MPPISLRRRCRILFFFGLYEAFPACRDDGAFDEALDGVLFGNFQPAGACSPVDRASGRGAGEDGEGTGGEEGIGQGRVEGVAVDVCDLFGQGARGGPNANDLPGGEPVAVVVEGVFLVGAEFENLEFFQERLVEFQVVADQREVGAGNPDVSFQCGASFFCGVTRRW